MSLTLINALYAGTAVSGPSGRQYLVGIDGTVAVDWPDVPTFVELGFIANLTSTIAAVAALAPIPVTSPPTYTLDDAVAKINEIIAALQS